MSSSGEHPNIVFDETILSFLADSFEAADQPDHHRQDSPKEEIRQEEGEQDKEEIEHDERQGKTAYLYSQSCFVAPAPTLFRVLLNNYIAIVHPLYPILSSQQLQRILSETDSSASPSYGLPWILLHAICFASVSHLAKFPDTELSTQNETRQVARQTYYQRAKALFELDYEQNKLVLVQSVILLSEWDSNHRANTSEYYSTLTWINAGLSIAESLDFHKPSSTQAPNIPFWLRRRIWWVLLTKDTFCSSILGKPFRIDIESNQVPVLDRADFPDFDNRNTNILTTICSLGVVLRSVISFRISAQRRQREISEFLPRILHQLTVLKSTTQTPTHPGLTLILAHITCYLYLQIPARHLELLYEFSCAGIQDSIDSVLNIFGRDNNYEGDIYCSIPIEAWGGVVSAAVALLSDHNYLNKTSIQQLQRVSRLNSILEILNNSASVWDSAPMVLGFLQVLRKSTFD
ncbi:uncharacterized protein V1516DRAFT_713682 [Lipomyces oligophaga]|uniref:uncharacterized protein n=1 Tax=Lipomyces oligophaga TaxID=45792 RepID=UPI0034CF2A6B